MSVRRAAMRVAAKRKRRVVKKKVNPTLPRGKWITAKVRVTENGTIEARVPRSAVKNPFDGVVLHRSTKRRRK